MSLHYSIIIPAFNEADFLPAALASVRAAMQAVAAPGEVIVVDNNSSDGTAAVAEEGGARVVFEPVNQIARARNSGARSAAGRYLIFLDADTVLTPGLLQHTLDLLDSGDYCGGGVTVAFDAPVRRYAQRILQLWNRISRATGIAAGCYIYCLREAFEGAGGFNEDVYISEEIWLSRRLRIWGKQHGRAFHIIDDCPIVTSARKLQWYTPWQMTLWSLPVLVCPPLMRFRFFCMPWYRRPDKPYKH